MVRTGFETMISILLRRTKAYPTTTNTSVVGQNIEKVYSTEKAAYTVKNHLKVNELIQLFAVKVVKKPI